MVLHKDVALSNMHHPYSWVYADETAREAATGMVPGDVGGLAFQTDDKSVWVLEDDSPVTWASIGSGGGGGTPAGTTGDLQYNDSGSFAASSVGLTWTEGTDETDSMLSVTGTLTAFSILCATAFSTAAIQSVGDLNLVMVDELQINGDGGTAGQILQSNGPGTSPTWEDNAGGYTDEQVRDVIAAAFQDSSSLDYTNTDGSDTMTIAIKNEYLMDWLGALISDSTNIDVTYDDAGDSFSIDLTAAAKTFTANFLIDGGGSAISTGTKGVIVIDRACSIVSNTVLADQSGSIAITIKKSSYSGYPTTSSIVASAKPTLSSTQKSQDTTLSGWTTSLSAGDILEVVVDSASTVTRVTLSLKLVGA